MAQIVVRGESVYQCTVCNRRIRVPTNRIGLDVIHYCTITAGCHGKLNKVTLAKDITSTPAIPPEVAGIQDWFQRALLYTHTQTIASNSWTITHNLGSIPIVHVFTNQMVNGKLTPVEIPQPPTTIIDSNTIRISFPEAVSGVAQLEALASRNYTNSATTVAASPAANIQVSTNTGVITIATLDNAPNITLTLTYAIPNQNFVTISYNNVTITPDANSPWADISRVYIGGVVYHVRSFNIINHSAALNAFVSGQIPPQGCPIYIGSALAATTNKGSVLLLEANTPFASVDKVIDQYVDLSAETMTSNNVVYSFGKVYAKPAASLSIYPYISVV